MKKIRNVAIIILIFFSSLINGQTNDFYVGLELGPSVKTVYGSVNYSNAMSFGYLGGISFQYNFSRLSIRTNFNYERKGFKDKDLAHDTDNNLLGEVTFHRDFDYLTVPILFKVNFGKRFNYYANVGPYLGYLLKATYTTESFADFPEDKYDRTNRFKKFDFGISSGIGVSYPLNNKLMMSLEVRNNLGLIDINTLTDLGFLPIKTNSTNLLLGIYYRFENN